jgi:hypothetical protein
MTAPSHTTRHAGPHRAVETVEVGALVLSRHASRGCQSPIRRFRFLTAASAQSSPGQEDRRASLARTSEAIRSREPEDVPSCSFGPSPCIRLQWPLLTSRSVFPRRPFSRKAGSPQVRTRSFPAQPPDLRRLGFDHERFAVRCPLALPASPHIRSCPSARSFAPRFLPTLGCPHAVAFRFARCGQLTKGLAPPRSHPCWAHNEKRGRDFSRPLDFLVAGDGFEPPTFGL